MSGRISSASDMALVLFNATNCYSSKRKVASDTDALQLNQTAARCVGDCSARDHSHPDRRQAFSGQGSSQLNILNRPVGIVVVIKDKFRAADYPDSQKGPGSLASAVLRFERS